MAMVCIAAAECLARAVARRARMLAARRRSGDIWPMLHIAKLAVGIRDIAHLGEVQGVRAKTAPPLRHQTRNFPRRAAEIVDGGSIYWVIGGAMLVRQRVLDIAEGAWDDGTRCAALLLDPLLVPVAGRATKAFQGWRYLSAADAPPDLGSVVPAEGEETLPPRLRQELRALCLL
jgi:hypothetical protein